MSMIVTVTSGHKLAINFRWTHVDDCDSEIVTSVLNFVSRFLKLQHQSSYSFISVQHEQGAIFDL